MMTITALQKHNQQRNNFRYENAVHLKLGRYAQPQWRAAFAEVEKLLAQLLPEWEALWTAAPDECKALQEARMYVAFVADSSSDMMRYTNSLFKIVDQHPCGKPWRAARAALEKVAPDEWKAYQEALKRPPIELREAWDKALEIWPAKTTETAEKKMGRAEFALQSAFPEVWDAIKRERV